jgi:hypothetical protein
MGAGVRAALGAGNHLERLRRLTEQLESLNQENLAEVLRIYEDELPILDEGEIQPFIAAWARFDPASALQRVLGWKLSGKRLIGMDAAIQTWAVENLMEARIAVGQASEANPDLRARLTESLVGGWVYTGEPGLLEYIESNTKGPGRSRLMERAITALIRKSGPEETLRWADGVIQIAELNQQRSVFRIVSQAVARRAPERAAEWVDQHTGNEYARGAPSRVAQHWAERDPVATMDWIRSQPAGQPREGALHRAFSVWLSRDWEAAAAWLQADSLTEFYDPALDVYARRLSARAGGEAIVWAERIEDEKLRLRCFRHVATAWYQQDAVAAETWLSSSPLDEAARGDVRNPSARRRKQERRGDTVAETESNS